jgi:hypothetical protein
LKHWKGEVTDVYSSIETPDADGNLGPTLLGSIPRLDEAAALECLDAAVAALGASSPSQRLLSRAKSPLDALDEAGLGHAVREAAIRVMDAARGRGPSRSTLFSPARADAASGSGGGGGGVRGRRKAARRTFAAAALEDEAADEVVTTVAAVRRSVGVAAARAAFTSERDALTDALRAALPKWLRQVAQTKQHQLADLTEHAAAQALAAACYLHAWDAARTGTGPIVPTRHWDMCHDELITLLSLE